MNQLTSGVMEARRAQDAPCSDRIWARRCRATFLVATLGVGLFAAGCGHRNNGIASAAPSASPNVAAPAVPASGLPDATRICVFSNDEASALIGRPVTGRGAADKVSSACHYETSPLEDNAGKSHYIIVGVYAPAYSGFVAEAKADCQGQAGPQDLILHIGDCAVAHAQLLPDSDQIGEFWANSQRYVICISDTHDESGAEATRRLADAVQLMAKRLSVS